MYFRSQKKLQGEVSLSDSIETDKEGNALQLMDVVGVDDTMLDDLHDRDSARQLHRLLHGLPEPYKEVFSLRTFGELPFSQIGELFGKTESWARVTYFRARAKLKEGLDGL